MMNEMDDVPLSLSLFFPPSSSLYIHKGILKERKKKRMKKGKEKLTFPGGGL